MSLYINDRTGITIQDIVTEFEMIHYALKVCRKIMVRKFCDKNIKNLEIVIDMLLDEIFDVALIDLSQDSLSITQKSLKILRERCADKLLKCNVNNLINMRQVFSSIFMLKCSPLPFEEDIHQYYDCVSQEFMACQSIVNTLRHPDSLYTAADALYRSKLAEYKDSASKKKRLVVNI